MVALAEELDAALQLAEEHKAKLHKLTISDSLITQRDVWTFGLGRAAPVFR
jgi:hypothetical protein